MATDMRGSGIWLLLTIVIVGLFASVKYGDPFGFCDDGKCEPER